MRAVRAGGLTFVAQGLLGVGSYAILVASRQALSAEQFAVFAVFWSVVFAFGLGIFGPLELLLFRLVAQRTTGAADVEIPRLRRWYLWVALAMGIAAAAFLLWSAGGWWVAVCAAIYFVVLRILAIQRAEAGGSQRLGRYAAQVGADGGARLVQAAGLLLLSAQQAAWWAGAVVAAGLLGALAARDRGGQSPEAPLRPSAASSARKSLRDVLILTGGTTVSVILSNSLPTVATLLGSRGQQLADFSSLTLVARIPIFFSGLGAALVIPAVAASTESGEPDTTRRVVRRVLTITGLGTALLGVVLGLLLPLVAGVAFGVETSVGSVTVWLLAISSAGLLFALVSQGIAIGLGHMGYVAYIWLAALAAGALALAVIPGSPDFRVAAASAVSAAVACLALLHTIVLMRRSGYRAATTSA